MRFDHGVAINTPISHNFQSYFDVRTDSFLRVPLASYQHFNLVNERACRCEKFRYGGRIGWGRRIVGY